MEIEFEVNGRPSAEEVREVTMSVGWRDPARHGLDVIQRIWDQAPCTVLAREGSKLVGMCRAFWDGGRTATIANMVVRPEYQGQGIGTRLMELIMGQLAKLAVKRITLDSAVGKEAFYERFGFQVRDTVTPMILRREEAGTEGAEGCTGIGR